MALILGKNGRRVLLLEKNSFIGGSMARFFKKGIPFDAGFHFTGGLQKDGILYDILTVLDMRDSVHPIFLSGENANCLFFESENRQYEIPYGIDNVKDRLKGYFPGEKPAVDRYFKMVENVCNKTPSMNLRMQSLQLQFIDEDYISLQDVLDELTQDRLLKAVLSGYTMCYGVKPQEVSFANHSRMCQGLYQSVARVENGGAAFIKAFQEKLRDYDIEICCNGHIAGLADINNKRVGRFILNSGKEISAENCILTIHPGDILKILPEQYVSNAFRNRICGFEPSAGFFSVFAVLKTGYEDFHFGDTIFSIFPHDDLNRLLDPAYTGQPALLLIPSVEQTRGGTYKTIVALEPSYPEHVKGWTDTRTGARPPEYQEYKNKRVDGILSRMFKKFPEYKNNLSVLDSASVLTFRDYLNSPDGSAYGIKQKMNQLNLFGKLPLRNLYATGQSSLLPGVIGAMLSSFIVGRLILEEDKYKEFLFKNLIK